MNVNKFCLLINDDPEDQAVFLNALTEVSPQTLCFTASDGIEALSLMLKDDIVPDFIFVEMSIPRLDGLSFLKEVKKIDSLKHIPVVVHANAEEEHDLAEIKAAGAKAIYLQRYNHFGVCNLINLYFNDNLIFVHPN